MAYTCNDAVSFYEDLANCPGEVVLPGMYAEVLFAPLSYFTAFPDFPSNVESMAAAGTLDGEFAMAADKYFIRVGCVPNQNNFSSEPQGEDGSRTFNTTATFVVKGTGEKVTGMAAQMLNEPCIVLMLTRDKKCRVIGSDAFPATISPTVASGTAVTDASNTTFQVVAAGPIPAPFYKGKIVTSDGTVTGDGYTAVSGSEG